MTDQRPRISQGDRPPVPGTLGLYEDVLVRFPSGKRKRAMLVGAVPGGAEEGGEPPKMLVTFVEDWGTRSLWVERAWVSPAPQPWRVRARRWLSSFLFGEE